MQSPEFDVHSPVSARAPWLYSRGMTIPFQVSGLPLDPFLPLFELPDSELAARGSRRCIADSKPGFPCRVSLVDAEVGETLILLHHTHHPVRGPYRGSGPIYVRTRAEPARLVVNEVPQVVRGRMMSLRAYDPEGDLISCDIADGDRIEAAFERLLSIDPVAYIHLHNAKPGCYSCRVDRASAP